MIASLRVILRIWWLILISPSLWLQPGTNYRYLRLSDALDKHDEQERLK